MNIELLVVGKTDSKEVEALVELYARRVNRYCRFAVTALPDVRNTRSLTQNQQRTAEGEAILRHIPPKAYVITLCIEGRQLSSEAIAAKLKELFTQGKSDIVFIIGGSLGLHPSVTARADLKLSMSPMTFPHQLARVMLLEQLYRAFKIREGSSYHK